MSQAVQRKAVRALRRIEVCPNLEEPSAAERCKLFLLPPLAAAGVRRRRAAPDGWAPLHLGVRTRVVEKHTRRIEAQWEEGQHAPHWVWPTLDEARDPMSKCTQRGCGTLVLVTWGPVWRIESGFEIGTVKHPQLSALCWVAARQDVPVDWVLREPGSEQLFRARPRSAAWRWTVEDCRSWTQEGIVRLL